MSVLCVAPARSSQCLCRREQGDFARIFSFRAIVSSSAFHDRLYVVLVSPRNPLNIGAAARALSNFGFSRLRVVNPYEAAFREAKSAAGASCLQRAEEYSTLAQAVADCTLVVGTTAARFRQLHHPLRPLAKASPRIRKALEKGGVALLFGSEKRGLSNQDFSHCHWLMRISTGPEQPSMNLGQAVAVCLYEISRDLTRLPAAERLPSASAADLERLTASLHDALRVSGYALAGKQDEQKLRRLIHRLAPSETDARLLLGMLRQMIWKMQRH
jgi:tRNA/rRNA methyltransferase